MIFFCMLYTRKIYTIYCLCCSIRHIDTMDFVVLIKLFQNTGEVPVQYFL